MSIEQLVAAVQSSGPSQGSNTTVAWYFVIGLIAAVLALVVTIFIHTSAGRSSK